MKSLEVALIEWPEGREAGGPRVIGHVTDSEIVARVRDLIATARRRELARLEAPVHLARGGEPDGRPTSGLPGSSERAAEDC